MCAMQANNLTITRNFRNAALLSEFYDKKQLMHWPIYARYKKVPAIHGVDVNWMSVQAKDLTGRVNNLQIL